MTLVTWEENKIPGDITSKIILPDGSEIYIGDYADIPDATLNFLSSRFKFVQRAANQYVIKNMPWILAKNYSGGGGNQPVVPAPMLGVLNANSDALRTSAKAAGATAVVLQAFWDLSQTTQGGAVNLAVGGEAGTNLLTAIDDANTKGLKVVLELATQYQPAWVTGDPGKGGVEPFRDQNGVAWTGGSGANIRDTVFSLKGRNYEADFINKTLAALLSRSSKITAIRIGCGMYGEMQYPTSTGTGSARQIWAYSAAARGGLERAPGVPANPVRQGYVMGSGTVAQDLAFSKWYVDALGDKVATTIDLIRNAGFLQPIFVMHPSYGLRSNWAVRSDAWYEQIASGTDFGEQMECYKNRANVIPYCTWMDGIYESWYTGDVDSPPDDSIPASHKLWLEAKKRKMTAGMMAENTGGSDSNAIVDRMYAQIALGYTGMFYFNQAALTANPSVAAYMYSKKGQIPNLV